MIVSLVFVWFIATLVFAILRYWRVWCISILCMFGVEVAGFLLSREVMVFDVAAGMLIWLLPISLITGAAVWVGSRLNLVFRKDCK